MRKILIPTDFSKPAFNAIKYALELFKYDKSEVYFLNAFEDDIYKDQELLKSDSLSNVIEIMRQQSGEKLNALIEEVKAIWPNPRHTYHQVASQHGIVDGIDVLVDTVNIDIIVMGTKGVTDKKSKLFGSNTIQVLRYVASPVLAIPANYDYTQPKKIVFATNYLIPYKRRELKLLCEMAVPYRAEIDMIYVSKSKQLSIRQEVNRQFIEDTLCKNETQFVHVHNKSVVEGINSYCTQHNADMLVMVNSRHSFLEDILYASTIDAVALDMKIPFLAMQNMRRD